LTLASQTISTHMLCCLVVLVAVVVITILPLLSLEHITTQYYSIIQVLCI